MQLLLYRSVMRLSSQVLKLKSHTAYAPLVWMKSVLAAAVVEPVV